MCNAQKINATDIVLKDLNKGHKSLEFTLQDLLKSYYEYCSDRPTFEESIHNLMHYELLHI